MSGTAIDHERSTENAARQWYLKGFEDAMKLLPDPSVAVMPSAIKVDISKMSDEEFWKEIAKREDPARCTTAKPLRFREGPVPVGLDVFYRWNVDNLGIVHSIGQGYGYGDIQDRDSFIKYEYAEWLPLSDILAMVEG